MAANDTANGSSITRVRTPQNNRSHTNKYGLGAHGRYGWRVHQPVAHTGALLAVKLDSGFALLLCPCPATKRKQNSTPLRIGVLTELAQLRRLHRSSQLTGRETLPQ